jgi:hypothetical protein
MGDKDPTTIVIVDQPGEPRCMFDLKNVKKCKRPVEAL